jgi:hypothetical protein
MPLTPKRAVSDGHDQVAGAGKLAACGGGDALHLGDDGLGQGADRCITRAQRSKSA